MVRRIDVDTTGVELLSFERNGTAWDVVAGLPLDTDVVRLSGRNGTQRAIRVNGAVVFDQTDLAPTLTGLHSVVRHKQVFDRAGLSAGAGPTTLHPDQMCRYRAAGPSTDWASG